MDKLAPQDDSTEEGVWMLQQHQTLGKLMRRLEEGEGCSLASPNLLICRGRLGIYRRVIEVCHRRIWRDNLHELWDGEEDKLPPIETLEAKLFHPGVTVLHARRGGGFKGGAILEA